MGPEVRPQGLIWAPYGATEYGEEEKNSSSSSSSERPPQKEKRKKDDTAVLPFPIFQFYI